MICEIIQILIYILKVSEENLHLFWNYFHSERSKFAQGDTAIRLSTVSKPVA